MPDESELPRTPTTLGVVLHIMERNHDSIIGQIGEVRRDVGDLRETVGELGGKITAHFSAHESPGSISAPHVDAVGPNKESEEAREERAIGRAVKWALSNWKAAAALAALFGGGGIGLGSCTLRGKPLASTSVVTATQTPSLRGAAPTMPPAAAIAPHPRPRAEAP